MLTRIREPEEGSYVVTILDASGELESRTTGSLAEAFAWQAYVQANGKFPDQPQHEPEVKAAKTKGNAK